MTKGKNETCAAILREATEDAYKRLIAPAIERELRTNLTETAEEGAMKVFGQNLKQLLMQPPIAGQTVLGWDPAFRTGCKLAVIDPFGKVIDTKVIYPTAPHNKVKESKDILKALIAKYHITLISVGNGTASRESEQIIADLIKEINAPVRYVITNEAGASVYSASKQATEEFPNFDVGQRSAVSIARRVQDPLAELVKIDPKAIGVGQYQHDMNQKKLDEMLHGTVEDCVNQVGVDLNTASAALFEYVSGITKTIAKNIVTYREENGQFTNRKQLLKVAKLGPKAYEQCAGFLRIRGGDEPLDATAVHPESYEAARAVLASCELKPQDILEGKAAGIANKLQTAKLAKQLGIGDHLTVDVHHPELTVYVEVREDAAYVHGPAEAAAGGLPLGMGGHAVSLLSGGIDSPVSSYMIAKRGVQLEMIHFASPPYTSELAREKVLKLAQELTPWCGRLAVFIIPFTEIQEEIRRKCPEDHFTLIMRRFMMRLADMLAQELRCRALVTGENLGQVASQTMQALAVSEDVTTMPVLRPLIGLDKEEIVKIARKIGTFDTSILPYEDCCTVFTPRHPKTKPSVEETREYESALDVEGLCQRAMANREMIRVKPTF